MTKSQKNNSKLIFNMTLIAAFAALEFVVTIFVSVPISFGGSGYINFSDLFVFLMASLVHPLIGGLVGGISGMLADLYLGYGFFAPFTLVIKMVEGIVSGYLFRFLMKLEPKAKWLTIIKGTISFIIGGFLMGVLYMVPDYVTYLTTPVGEITYEFIFVDLGFNVLQGLVNSVLAIALYVCLEPLKATVFKRSLNKEKELEVNDNSKNDNINV